MTDLLIVGAGPTGLTAAAEAVRHGLSVRIIDANQHSSIHSKALVIHSRTLEVFTDMGFVDTVLERGQEFRALNIYADGKALSRIDFRAISWQDAIYPFWLSLPQSETERLLEEHLGRLGVQVERQTRLTALAQEGDQVHATLTHINDDGETVSEEVISVPWLVGCDGARSATRKLSGIPFEGTAEDELFILGDVDLEWDQPEDEGQNFMSADGILLVVPLPEPKRYRIIAHMPALSVNQEPEITSSLLQSLLDQRTGMQSQVKEMTWSSSFSIKHLVAAKHRQGRVFLAGDAAHIHSPVGGQGLNTGIQDAYNLMWKLALVHHGNGSEKLLDSYQTERHEVAEATIKKVSFATHVVTLKNPISRTLRNQLASILVNTDAVRNRMGRDVGMLDISYTHSEVVKEDAIQLNRAQKMLQAVHNSEGHFENGPASGERTPNVLYMDEKGKPHSLVDSLYGTQHTLLLFAGLSDKRPSETLSEINSLIAQRYPAVRTVLVTTTAVGSTDWSGDTLVNKGGAIHRRFGATEEAVYLIRPDNHIGYRSQPVTVDLVQAYLEQVFVPTVIS
ncbi:MAG: NADPH-dependent dioxygenase [Cellvibrionaceae bacterium]|jgi:NADPH-dependent dioxygenase